MGNCFGLKKRKPILDTIELMSYGIESVEYTQIDDRPRSPQNSHNQ